MNNETLIEVPVTETATIPVKDPNYVNPYARVDKAVIAIRNSFLKELPALNLEERRAVLATIGYFLSTRLEALEATLSPIVKPGHMVTER